MKLTLFKLRYQPLSMLIPLFFVCYTAYFIKFKITYFPQKADFWFKSSELFLNALIPFLISLITAIQFSFEEQRRNLNPVLGLPKRDTWVSNVAILTAMVYLEGALVFGVGMAWFGKFDYWDNIEIWLNLYGQPLIWIPIFTWIGIAFNYRTGLIVGAVLIPFMLNVASQSQGSGWSCLPWFYNFTVEKSPDPSIMPAVLSVAGITLLEQLVLNYYVNHFWER